MEKYILTINGGSSSIKFALYSNDGSFSRTLHGKIDRIGQNSSNIVYINAGEVEEKREVTIPDFSTAIETLNSFLAERVDFDNIVVVGHRIVHGMGRRNHSVVTSELISELKEVSAIDPEHMPLEIAIIEMFERTHPLLPQVACFDTVFHRDMPRVAQLLPIPRRFEAKGMRRYGFHGLSCSFIVEELNKLDPERSKGRVIIAHLGNGASVTAIRNGNSVDTSMGFTPTGGIPMSSRTGDMDPGALLYIMKMEGLSVDTARSLVNHESGLLGVSETSSNMYDLLEKEGVDPRAHEAVDFFVTRQKRVLAPMLRRLAEWRPLFLREVWGRIRQEFASAFVMG